MSRNFEMRSDIEELLRDIEKFIIEKDCWVERREICEALGLPLNAQLVEDVRNSKIGQLLYNKVRKDGFGYQKVLLDSEDKFNYELWVCSPNVLENDNLEEQMHKLHGNDFIMAELKRKVVKTKEISTENQTKIIEQELNNCDNEYLEQIVKSIKQGENLFITGYAGTGKSFILNKLKKMFRIDVTSTTGLAAVNVQGQTIHSWSGVGICNKPVIDVVEKILKRSKLKKQIQECEILAIDEISMLDGMTFDYIDQVLRNVRDCDKPMGGIQMLMFGDFFQLPPVKKENGFCFNSACWKELDLKTIFLEKIYRQSDERFIKALNNLRLNELTESDIELFMSRQIDDSLAEADMLHIFSTNYEADNYNNMKFRQVENRMYMFNSVDKIHRKNSAIVVDRNNLSDKLTKFDLMTLEAFDKSCKAPSALDLKVGCKVMLLINLDFNKGLINGSTGEVLEISQNIEDEHILVKFDNGVEQAIPKNTFEAYRDGEVVVSREQYPLRLAYGITIHKSQGMTLDNLIVDCNRIFECGQVYVALSRITSLKGLYLKAFSPQKVRSNPEVVEFYKNLRAYN